MNLPRLRLWQEAALPPGDCDSDIWTARHRGESTGRGEHDDELRRSLDRSRENARRARSTALYGLVLSAFLGLPTGLVFTYSTAVSMAGPQATQCVAVGNMLDGALQRGLQKYRSLHGLTESQSALLESEVCDPLLKSIVPTLVANITDGIDVQDVSRAMATQGPPQSRRGQGWSMLRAVVGAGAQ